MKEGEIRFSEIEIEPYGLNRTCKVLLKWTICCKECDGDDDEEDAPIQPMKLARVKMSARFQGTVMYARKPSFHSFFSSAQARP